MKTMNKFRSILLRSTDRGRSWSLLSTIAVDPTVGEEGFCEPVMVLLGQGERAGRIIAHLRIGSNKTLTDPQYDLSTRRNQRTAARPGISPTRWNFRVSIPISSR